MAAQRQLGPRRGTRHSPSDSQPRVGHRGGRHAVGRTQPVRRRLHGRPEGPDRPDALQGSGRPVFRLARLPGVLRSEPRLARWTRRRGAAEGRRRHRGRVGPAAAADDVLCPRRLGYNGNCGDGDIAEPVRAAGRAADARPRVRAKRSRTQPAARDRADARPVEPPRRRWRDPEHPGAPERPAVHSDRHPAAEFFFRAQCQPRSAAARRRVYDLRREPCGNPSAGGILRRPRSRAPWRVAAGGGGRGRCRGPSRRRARLQEPWPEALSSRPQAGSTFRRSARAARARFRGRAPRARVDGEPGVGAARACRTARARVRRVARARGRQCGRRPRDAVRRRAARAWRRRRGCA